MLKNALKIRMLGSLLGLSVLASATPGLAENRPGAVTVSPFVGGYTFDGDQHLEISPIFGLAAGYNFTKNWGAEAKFGYVMAESKNPNYPETDAYSYGMDALYHFNLTQNLVPFIAAGAGGTNLHWPAHGIPNSSAWSVDYGVGVKYFVSDNVALRADVRHVYLPADSQSNLEYTAGVTFQIGGVQPAAKASSGEVANAPVVAALECPLPEKDTTAPTVSLTSPSNGASDAGVRRKVYVAFSEPIDPATMTSSTFYLLKDGQPVPGTVADPTTTSASITPAGDFQPGAKYTARVTTGVKDLAGNPLAEDYVWSFQTSALPETKVTTKVVVINKFVMLEDTHFEFDRANLTDEGKAMLDQNIKIMKDNPEMKVRVAGYTSASGTAAYNQKLSERRAVAVKTYLIDAGGLAPERLETIGYGATRPAVHESIPSDLDSNAAKSNMRVLFEVIVK